MISRKISPPSQSFLLLGPRLTGKSTWLKSHFKSALYLDLLSEELYLTYLSNHDRFYNDVLAFHKRSPNDWVVLDEIQRIPTLLNEVHRLIENFKIKFALSGSSARKLKRGGANLLAGRAIEMKMAPLSVEEIGNSFEVSLALQYGTLPSVHTADLKLKKQILKTYTHIYLKEEIQSEGLVRKLPAFSKFLKIAAESITQEVNFSTISREIGINSKTIAEYYQILEDTLIGFILQPWTKSVRKQLAGSPKFYFFDNGVTSALRENLSDPPSGANLGAFFEQLVIGQIRIHLEQNDFEGSLHFWKARGGNEVDLVIAKGSKPICIVEIKSTKNPNKKDTSGIQSFREEYPSANALLITQQDKPSLTHGIESFGIRDSLTRILEIVI